MVTVEVGVGDIQVDRRREDRRTALSIVLIGAMHLLVRWVRLRSVGGGFDSSLLGNVLWRLAHGFDSQTAMTGGHYLSTHASPVLGLFLPVFRFIPEYGMPLIYMVQVASVMLVAWAGYLVGRHVGLSTSSLRWLVGFTLLSSTGWIATQHQVNETTFGLGPLAMALALSVRGDRPRNVLIWAGLAASCRIELAAAVLVGGIVAWASGRRSQGRAIVGLSAVLLLGYLTWLFLNPYETESIAAHFAHLGATPREVAATVASRPWAVFEPVFSAAPFVAVLFWLLPFGAVGPMFQAKWLLVALPGAAIAILGVWAPADIPIEHYWYSFLAAGAIATPLALARSAWLKERQRFFLVAGGLAGWLLLSPFLWFFFPSSGLTSTDRRLMEVVRELDSKFITVPASLSQGFIERPWVALFPRPFLCHESIYGPYTAPNRPPDIVVMPRDALDRFDIETADRFQRIMRSYALVTESEHFEAWQLADPTSVPYDDAPCSEVTFDLNDY